MKIFNQKQLIKLSKEKKLFSLFPFFTLKNDVNLDFYKGEGVSYLNTEKSTVISIILIQFCAECKFYVFANLGDFFGIDDGEVEFHCNDCI